jgi:hypothetical protein
MRKRGEELAWSLGALPTKKRTTCYHRGQVIEGKLAHYRRRVAGSRNSGSVGDASMDFDA